MNKELEISDVNLIIPGMPKCGSFFLYDLLAQHPDICMHNIKEPNYFAGLMDRETYLNGFKKDKKYAYYGEASVVVLGDEQALKKLKEESPNVKIIVLLRHPVKRAISHYHHRRNAQTDSRSWSQLLEDMNSNDCYPIYYSSYELHLNNLYKIFTTEQIKIVISEELYSNTQTTLNSIFEFLNVSENIINLHSANKNIGYVSKNGIVTKWIKKVRRNRSTLKISVLRILPFLSGISGILEKKNQKSIPSQSEIEAHIKNKIEQRLSKEIEFVQESLKNKNIWN